MTTFVDAVLTREVTTTNGMPALATTANSCVDLFFKIGAMRNGNIVPLFSKAFAENPSLACSIALWARDVRGGAGERKVFRDILKYLQNTPAAGDYYLSTMLIRTPEVGRWDDLLEVTEDGARELAFSMIASALQEGNALAAKWMPRKGLDAVALRQFLKMTPKQYRKTLVNLTNVVETQMCAKDWDSINFNHVPSVASSRYKKAFARHTSNYAKWVADLAKPESGAKINADAIFPHDVLKGLINYSTNYNKTELGAVVAQWNALPNYVGDNSVMAVVDVSGSMSVRVGANKNLSAIDIAVSLGLYVSDKNKGKFKDLFMTFSSTPEFVHLKGNIVSKISQMMKSNWDMSTNLEAAFEMLLATAVKGKVSVEEMPKTLLIMSDMQFNGCVATPKDKAFDMIKGQYAAAGYNMPNVVFWNLNAHDNVPVSFTEQGVALVSGFSPAILKSVLGGKSLTPYDVMMTAVDTPRYRVA